MPKEMKESSICRERAQAILAATWDLVGDYFVVADDDGDEFLISWGAKVALATNRTTMSWLGSGSPSRG